MLVEFFLLLVTTIVLLTLYVNWRPKNYPKGPFAWPILGNLPNLAKVKDGAMHTLFWQYSKEYGKVLSFQLASYPAVVIHDHKLIKEAWNNPILCGRPKLHGARERTGGVIRGLMFQDNEEWTEQRRFALRHLRDFGFGKKDMETLVMDEALELVQGLKKSAGEPISTQNLFNVAILNALWTITAGERFSHDDDELKEIVAAITRNVSSTSASRAVFFMPWLVKLAPRLSGWEKYKEDLPYTYNFIKKYTESRLQTYDGNSPEHFTDVYIDEIRKTTNPKSSFYGKRGELTMTATLQDLFVAGAETTSTTLTWQCLYLALYPEKQKKLQAEIDSVLGNKLPSLEDKSKMPYTEATIMETMRSSAMVPLGLFHRALQDFNLGGYFIPKDTMLIANLHAVHHDKEHWGDPENYRPERFLSSDEKTVVKNDAFIPFSYGKRICPGEGLALQELFLFITLMFQQFDVTWDSSSPKPDATSTSVSVIAAPKPHKLIFTPRNSI